MMSMIGLFPILDYQKLGVTTIPQMKPLYGSLIGSRIVEGAGRSQNAWKERLLRDSLGWVMWFYATDIIKKGFLLVCTAASGGLKESTQNLLLVKRAKPVLKEVTVPKSPLQKASHWVSHQLKVVNWHVNPDARYYAPTSEQLRERQAQWLEGLERLALSVEEKALHSQRITSTFGKCITANNYARTIGIALNIALLGFTVPELNILLTQMRNEAEMLRKLETAKQLVPSSGPANGPSQAFVPPSSAVVTSNSYVPFPGKAAKAFSVPTPLTPSFVATPPNAFVQNPFLSATP